MKHNYRIFPYPLKITEQQGTFTGVPRCDETGGVYDGIRDYFPDGDVPIRFINTPVSGEAYTLRISENGAEIAAAGEAGHFYGAMTLCQLVRQFGKELPCLTIEDVPVTAHRGVQICCGQVHVEYRKEWLFRYIRMMAEMKINTIYLYFEWDFAYACLPHPNGGSFIGPKEAKEICGYAKRYNVTIVPAVNLMGHSGAFLAAQKYHHLQEYDAATQTQRTSLTDALCPSSPETKKLLEKFIDELCDCFDSPVIHVGGDEVSTVGVCPVCSERKKSGGRMRIYLEHFLYINDLLAARGRKMGIWGDQILIFQPGSVFWANKDTEPQFAEQNKKLLDRLRGNTIIYDWWYEGGSPDSIHFLQENNLQFIVCSSTNSCYTNGVTLSQQKSQRSLYREGLRCGACGILTCDWMNFMGSHAEMAVMNLASGALFSWSGVDRFDSDEEFEKFRRTYAKIRFHSDAIVDMLHLTGDYNSELLRLFPQKFKGNTLRKAVFFNDDPLDVFLRFDVFFQNGGLQRYRAALEKAEGYWKRTAEEGTDDGWLYFQKLPVLVLRHIYARYTSIEKFYEAYDEAAQAQFEDERRFCRALGRAGKILKEHRDSDFAEITAFAEDCHRRLGLDYASVLRLKKTQANLTKLMRYLSCLKKSKRLLPAMSMLSAFLFDRPKSPFWLPRSNEWAYEPSPFTAYETDDHTLTMCYDFDYDKLNPIEK